MPALKRWAQRFLNRLGYQLVRTDRQGGRDALQDMQTFLPGAAPLILDVGANVGQTVQRFKQALPAATIHSFEPSPRTFQELEQAAAGYENVHAWNCGLAATAGRLTFQENRHSEMSSFLPLGKSGWGSVQRSTEVDVTTIDAFLAAQQIERVDILKSDTQGYDLEVFKGAEQALREGRIGLIFLEIIFSDMYAELPSLDQIYQFLTRRDYQLVSFYEFRYQDHLASWTDALFVHRDYGRRRQAA